MGYPSGVILILFISTNRLHRWCKEWMPLPLEKLNVNLLNELYYLL